MEKCPECGSVEAQERVELIVEPFEGRKLTYGSKYLICQRCKVSWYSSAQMREQLYNRSRNLSIPHYLVCPLLELYLLADDRFRKLFFVGNVYPRELR